MANAYFELLLKSHFLGHRGAEIYEFKQDTGKKNEESLLPFNIIIYFNKS